MKSKIREMVIRISYSEYRDLIYGAILTSLFVAVIALAYFECEIPAPLAIAIFSIFFLVIWSNNCFEAISERQITVVKKNKLINIILSDIRVWDWLLIWLIVTPILFALNIEFNFISSIIAIIVIVVIIIISSAALARFFKKRIVE